MCVTLYAVIRWHYVSFQMMNYEKILIYAGKYRINCVEKVNGSRNTIIMCRLGVEMCALWYSAACFISSEMYGREENVGGNTWRKETI
jgi:hypothetical protein